MNMQSGLREGALVLADGSVFEGDLIGADRDIASGEVVFNTVMSGYQEVITDPSYAGQIINFTSPHIGNYGVNAADAESRGAFCRGVIVRDLARRHSNHRAEGDLDGYLRTHGVPAIAGIDTRRLTRLIRDTGSIPGAFGALAEDELRAAATAEPGTGGVDLVAQVTTPENYTIDAQSGADRVIVALDFGMKRNIGRNLSRFGLVHVLNAGSTAADVLARRPHGVFLSNGPGDPGMVPYAVDTIRELVGRVPIFGICLGHQLLGRAIGAETVKLPFGHHGGNHPVKDLDTGAVQITSQNHNFAVSADSLGDRATMTHVNLNDGVCEGLRVTGEQAFSVQHHPEAHPGPHDARHLFDRFAQMIDGSGAR
jgi:carbamoyl-phosphate synthase small subunit